MPKVIFALLGASFVLASCNIFEPLSTEEGTNRAIGFVAGHGWRPTEFEIVKAGLPCSPSEMGILVREQRATTNRVGLVCVSADIEQIPRFASFTQQ